MAVTPTATPARDLLRAPPPRVAHEVDVRVEKVQALAVGETVILLHPAPPLSQGFR